MPVYKVQYQLGKGVGLGQHFKKRAVQHTLPVDRKHGIVLLQKGHKGLLHRRRADTEHQSVENVVLRAFRFFAEVVVVQLQNLRLQKSAVVHAHEVAADCRAAACRLAVEVTFDKGKQFVAHNVCVNEVQHYFHYRHFYAFRLIGVQFAQLVEHLWRNCLMQPFVARQRIVHHAPFRRGQYRAVFFVGFKHGKHAVVVGQ